MKESRKIWLVLALGFFARLGMGLISLGADHPNETYRLLEPLAAQWGYATRLPWEWTDGLLSALPIRALALVLSPIRDWSALAQLRVLKLCFALLSLLPIIATWRWLAVRRSSAVALAGAAFVAFWPEFIYRSVRLMDYSLEAALLAGALWLAYARARSDDDRVGAAAAGAVLGLAFFVRFQSGLYFMAFAVIELLRGRRALARLLALTLAYGATIAALAALEARLTGAAFLSPFLKYVHFNWVENGAAKFYGVAPWHRYLSESFKAYGFAPFVLFLGVGACAAKRRADSRELAVLFALPLLTLSLLAHKEGRFAFGFLWVLVPLAFSAEAEWVALGGRRAWRAAIAAALFVGIGVNVDRVSRRALAHAEDVREWVVIGEEFDREPGPIALVVRDDPDAVPGGFFLRLHGELCYRYAFDGQPRVAGDCDPAGRSDGVLARNPETGHWGLIPGTP